MVTRFAGILNAFFIFFSQAPKTRIRVTSQNAEIRGVVHQGAKTLHKNAGQQGKGVALEMSEMRPVIRRTGPERQRSRYRNLATRPGLRVEVMCPPWQGFCLRSGGCGQKISPQK